MHFPIEGKSIDESVVKAVDFEKSGIGIRNIQFRCFKAGQENRSL